MTTQQNSCACEACTLRRELKRADDLVDHIAKRLGCPRHDPHAIRQTFDFMMDRYEDFMKEAMAEYAAAQKGAMCSGEDA